MRKSDLVRLAGPLGLYALARRLCRYHPRLLMYHRFSMEPEAGHVSQATFERQVRHILEHYTPVTMNALASQLRGEIPIEKNQIAITIDDGYLDFYEVAFPVLKRLGVPATLFVTTGFADGRLWLWPDKVAWLLGQVDHFPEGVSLGRDTLAKCRLDASVRFRLWDRIVQYLLAIPDVEKHHWIAVFAKHLRLDVPVQAPPAYAPATWAQLEEMQAAGIEIGGHTVTHPSLGRVVQDELHNEVTGCLAELTARLGSRPRSFCYPNGTVQDYSQVAMDVVKAAGYTCAVVAYADAAKHQRFYALRRHVGAEDMFQFMKSVSGLEWLGHRLARRMYEPAPI